MFLFSPNPFLFFCILHYWIHLSGFSMLWQSQKEFPIAIYWKENHILVDLHFTNGDKKSILPFEFKK